MFENMFENINEKIFIFIVMLVFIYFIYQQIIFQQNIFGLQEAFTPQQVENIIQPPGSNKIGTSDMDYWKKTQMKVVSNGYTNKMINNLKPSHPSPFDRETTDAMGNFPAAEKEKYPLATEEFEYPNDYKFTVDYPCRKTATGMFSDCGVYSANLAWSANPYKGLNCPIKNKKNKK